MATYLYRLGRFAYRRRGWLTLVWVLILAAAGVGAATLSRPMSSSFSIPGTESQQALDLLAKRMPQAGTGNASARVVFVAPAGADIGGRQQHQDVARRRLLENVFSVGEIGLVRCREVVGGQEGLVAIDVGGRMARELVLKQADQDGVEAA